MEKSMHNTYHSTNIPVYCDSCSHVHSSNTDNFVVPTGLYMYNGMLNMLALYNYTESSHVLYNCSKHAKLHPQPEM